ncbi:MAG: MmgE/PrpD family protein [Betaproteobacteria bacterium]|nr:MmgE/PrpD family protein [Betaproteobacteria bacterium]
MNDVNVAPVAGEQSQRLIEHLTQLTLNGLDKRVPREARNRLLDGLGCGLYGAKMPWGKITADVAFAEESRGKASVFGRLESIAPARAALCNGTAMHGIELDDILGHVHPGSVVIPAALAAAEHCGASGERVLLGLIAGYEAMVRLSRAIGEAAWGFHITGIAGPVGAAVAAGVLMELSHEQIMNAVGIACSNAAGIKSFTQGNGGMIKRLHAGRAAESGVLACLLAEREFTAPAAAIDGRFGLLEVFGGEKANPTQLVDKLGHDYIICHIWTKVYPFCGALHTTAQALKSLRDKYDLQPAAIKNIRVGINSRAVALNGAISSPKETMAAQYSLPFVAAVALAADPKDPRSFENSALDNPTVCDLARRVESYVDPEMEAKYPRHRAAKVEVHLSNGTQLEASLLDAHGTPADPCSEDEVKEKFRCLTAESCDSRAIESILNIVEHIEELPSIAPLSAALAAGITS